MKLNFLILFLLYFGNIHSQSIFSALRHDDKLELRENIGVEEIVTEIKFYNKNGVEQKKEITSVNWQNRLVTELRYNSESILTARLIFLYDSTQTKSVSRKFETWHPIIGYSSETASYEYDKSGFLIKKIDKNSNGKISREIVIKNDERGNPIELKSIESNGIDYGKEIATYDYNNNIAEISVLDKYGNVLSKNTMKIDYSIKEKNDIINEFGDIIKNDDYEFEFKYDRNKNWIKQIRYKIVDGAKIKNAVFTREIKYRK